jgi:hypothetical protein
MTQISQVNGHGIALPIVVFRVVGQSLVLVGLSLGLEGRVLILVDYGVIVVLG